VVALIRRPVVPDKRVSDANVDDSLLQANEIPVFAILRLSEPRLPFWAALDSGGTDDRDDRRRRVIARRDELRSWKGGQARLARRRLIVAGDARGAGRGWGRQRADVRSVAILLHAALGYSETPAMSVRAHRGDVERRLLYERRRRIEREREAGGEEGDDEYPDQEREGRGATFPAAGVDHVATDADVATHRATSARVVWAKAMIIA